MSWQSAVLADKPQNWLRLAETTGTVAVDAIGNAPGTYHPGFATSTAGALAASGDLDTAITFDGSTQFVSFARQIQDDFSLECWFKTTAGVGRGLNNWYDASGIIGADVVGQHHDFGCSIEASGNIMAGTGTPDVSAKSRDAGFNDGAWHHLVVTRVKASGLVSIYVDGVLQATAKGTTASLTAPTQIAIASVRADAAVHPLAGSVDEVLTYTYALSQAQVTTHFQAATTPFSGLISGGAVPITQAPVGVEGLWTLIVTDLRGMPLGELEDANPRRVSPTMSNIDTLTFSVRGDNALVGYILNCDARLKVYDDTGQLRFHGPIISVNPQGQADATAADVVCASPLWDLQARLLGKSAQGVSFGSVDTPRDRCLIAQDIINALNLESDTGIRVGALSTSSPTYTGALTMKPASDALMDLATAVDGFEFQLLPSEPVHDSTGTQIAVFTAASALGQAQTDIVFEFGFGLANVQAMSAPRTRDGQGNRWFSLPTNFPSNGVQAPIQADNFDSQAKWPLMERVIPGTMVSDDLRTKLATEYARVRGEPRQVIQFTPAVDAPAFFHDYDIGDTIKFRAMFGSTLYIDALFRVFGADIDIDQYGQARAQPKLVFDTSASTG